MQRARDFYLKENKNMKKLIIILGLLSILCTYYSFAQLGSALIYLKNDSLMNVSISLIHQRGMLDAQGQGIPFFAIDSLITPDRSIAYQIQGFISQVQIKQRAQGYFIDLSTIFPTIKRKLLDDEKTIPLDTLSVNNNSQLGNYTYPNIILLPISVIAFGLAWDYFEDVSQLSETIDQFQKLKLDTSKLESSKTRKTILGVAFALAGVVNTIIAFEKVEVKVSPNSLSFVYHF